VSTEAFEQIAIMIGEMTFIGIALLAASRARAAFGASLLYILFGAIFQYASLITADASVRITPSFVVSSGSVVFFPAVLFLALYIYLTTNPLEARKVIFSVAVSNLLVLPLSLCLGLQLQSPLVVHTLEFPPSVYQFHARVVVAGSLTLLADALFLCIVYELLRRYIGSIFARLFLSLTITCAFDSLIFSVATFFGRPDFWAILGSQIAAKTVAAFVYASVLALYLHRFPFSEPQADSGELGFRKIFRILTYRQTYEELRTAAHRDSLTNAYNRRFFDESFGLQVEAAKTSELAFSMLMVDVDHFKQINDAYGHSEGDEVLRVIAQALDSNVRGSDFVCRYGGEEFAVLMPQTNLEQAAGLAERIIRAVPEACRGWRATLGHDITVTIGIASFPAEAGDAAELLKVADRRLYAGKRAGRNRTVATDEPVDREASTRS